MKPHALELVSFLYYSELRVKIFRCDRPTSETHESGDSRGRMGPKGVTPPLVSLKTPYPLNIGALQRGGGGNGFAL